MLQYNNFFKKVKYFCVEVAELLLEKGADVNAVDRGGLIPLHNAASYGHVEIAQGNDLPILIKMLNFFLRKILKVFLCPRIDFF